MFTCAKYMLNRTTENVKEILKINNITELIFVNFSECDVLMYICVQL